MGLRDDWQAQLTAAVRDLGVRGVRFHGHFDDDMGPVVSGTMAAPVYNFTLVDKLHDNILSAGAKPIVELSFMPAVLANCTWTAPNHSRVVPAGTVVNPGHAPCRTGMAYKHIDMLPVTWDMWYRLVRTFALHIVARHGIAEVAQWRFEGMSGKKKKKLFTLVHKRSNFLPWKTLNWKT